MTEFALRVGGNLYPHWKSLSFTRSLEQLAHSFSMTVADQRTEDGSLVKIREGNECQILIDDEVITSGYIDTPAHTYTAKTRNLNFSGRSKTADLVDCSAIFNGGQWNNQGLLQIAKDLCAPFDISVSSNVDLGKPFSNPNFKLEEGETVYEALSRGAQARGVLMQTDADGNLVFDRSSSFWIDTPLEYGVNIFAGGVSRDWSNRFYEYILKTQSSGNDEHNGRATSLSAAAYDTEVSRFRTTTILTDTEDSLEELQKRADWERNVRAGRSLRVNYTVHGWKHREGLWSPNHLVQVIDPRADLDAPLIISGVTLTRDESGTFAKLNLTFPEAFDVSGAPPSGY